MGFTYPMGKFRFELVKRAYGPGDVVRVVKLMDSDSFNHRVCYVGTKRTIEKNYEENGQHIYKDTEGLCWHPDQLEEVYIEKFNPVRDAHDAFSYMMLGLSPVSLRRNKVDRIDAINSIIKNNKIYISKDCKHLIEKFQKLEFYVFRCI